MEKALESPGVRIKKPQRTHKLSTKAKENLELSGNKYLACIQALTARDLNQRPLKKHHKGKMHLNGWSCEMRIWFLNKEWHMVISGATKR